MDAKICETGSVCRVCARLWQTHGGEEELGLFRAGNREPKQSKGHEEAKDDGRAPVEKLAMKERVLIVRRRVRRAGQAAPLVSEREASTSGTHLAWTACCWLWRSAWLRAWFAAAMAAQPQAQPKHMPKPSKPAIMMSICSANVGGSIVATCFLMFRGDAIAPAETHARSCQRRTPGRAC